MLDVKVPFLTNFSLSLLLSPSQTACAYTYIHAYTHTQKHTRTHLLRILGPTVLYRIHVTRCVPLLRVQQSLALQQWKTSESEPCVYVHIYTQTHTHITAARAELGHSKECSCFIAINKHLTSRAAVSQTCSLIEPMISHNPTHSNHSAAPCQCRSARGARHKEETKAGIIKTANVHAVPLPNLLHEIPSCDINGYSVTLLAVRHVREVE